MLLEPFVFASPRVWMNPVNVDPHYYRVRPLFIIAAAIVPVLLCWALGAVKDSVTNATAVLVLVLFVVAVACQGDRLAGLVAALSSAAAFDFYLTEPYQRFDIYDPNDVEAAVLLVLVGVGVTELALWGRRQQGRASRRAGYLKASTKPPRSSAIANPPGTDHPSGRRPDPGGA